MIKITCFQQQLFNESLVIHLLPVFFSAAFPFKGHTMSPPAPGPRPERPPVLDGGWGWVIVAASFLALLLANGSPQSVGVLYPEWLLAYGETKATTAWVGSVVSGVGLTVGE